MQDRIRLVLMVLLFAVVSSGCNRVDLYQNLSEEDANEILVLLAEHGIKAEKRREVRQNEVSWAIAVERKDVIRARELLVKNNLPRRTELGLTGVYKEKGLIPTPDEQKARYLLALKGEIINSLERLPEVVDADVVLNIPTPDEFADAETRKRLKPTSSVVVKLKPSASGNITESKIQEFVANAVEGMNPRDVTVILSYVNDRGDKMASQSGGGTSILPVVNLGQQRAVGTPIGPQEEVMGIKVDPESKTKLKVYILVFVGLLLILALALVISIIQANRLRRHVEGLVEPKAGRYPEIEGHVVDGTRHIEGPSS